MTPEIKLLNEVKGLLGTYEAGLRELIGNTNFAVLKLRAEEAEAAAPSPDQQPDIRAQVIEDIGAERRRQVEVEGWTAEHDDEHVGGEMARAAACYALGTVGSYTLRRNFDRLWPWDKKWWKPKDRRRDLIRTAALIVAEIERLDRAT